MFDDVVAEIVVAGQVDPALPTSGDAPDDLIPLLLAEQFAIGQLRREHVRGAALGAKALGATGFAILTAADRLAAARTEPFGFGHFQHHRGGGPRGYRRQVDPAAADSSAARPADPGK